MATSRENSYIQATLRTINAQVGSNVRIGVRSTYPLRVLSYAVFGRGRLAFAETIPGSQNQYNEINFRATSDMAPRCRIVVYAVSDADSRRDAEIIADALEFEVGGTLTNSVEIFTSR